MTNPTIVLGIETSCDETAAAVLADGKEILSSVVSSQVDLHKAYGGVVPEMASRAHIEMLLPVVEEALKNTPKNTPPLTAVAATNGPGLIGALLVGVSAGKALSLALNIPFIAVNHLEAHLFATFLDEPDIELPLVVLLVSGGHTMLILMREFGKYEVLGQTLDDAAGEAFDKTARALGLGYPGGPEIDKLAASFEGEDNIKFPRPMLSSAMLSASSFLEGEAKEKKGGKRKDKSDKLNFSFSGLKTAVVNYIRKAEQNGTDISTPAVAAAFQNSVVEVLSKKTVLAVEQFGAKAVCLAGGVAANSQLREEFQQLGVPCYLASREMCTDNAAMVAAAGHWHLMRGDTSELNVSVYPSLKL